MSDFHAQGICPGQETRKKHTFAIDITFKYIEATFKDGIPDGRRHGPIEEYYPGGQLKSVDTYVNGKKR